MILGREEIVTALFRETDRAQRMKMPLALIKIGIIGWEGSAPEPDNASFDVALQETVQRAASLLRCYDAVGQMGDREFLLILPGCRSFNARTMAERLRDEIFASSKAHTGSATRFAACFGFASSAGRSPFVVLREVDMALLDARSKGAGAIECISETEKTDPAIFFSRPQDEMLRR